MPAANLKSPNWRNPLFLVAFVPPALAWLVFVGWMTWRCFHPVMGWVGEQHEILQELLGTAIVLAWAMILAFGLGAAAHCAEKLALLRPRVAPFAPPEPLSADAKKWERGRNALPGPARRDETAGV